MRSRKPREVDFTEDTKRVKVLLLPMFMIMNNVFMYYSILYRNHPSTKLILYFPGLLVVSILN